MSARVTLEGRIAQYLNERRRLGFELASMGHALNRFARFVRAAKHRGTLTVELMAAWARQGKGGEGTRATSARLLHQLNKVALKQGGRLANRARLRKHGLQSFGQ